MEVGNNALCLKDKLKNIEPLHAIQLVISLEKEVERIIRARTLPQEGEAVGQDIPLASAV